MERKLLHTKQWKSLSGSEKILYIHLKGRYDSSNNGELELPYTAMKDVGGCLGSRTVFRAFKGLEEKGWIKRTQAGGLYRKINRYALTWNWDHYDGKEINEEKLGLTRKPQKS